jgi:hypothetical protein
VTQQADVTRDPLDLGNPVRRDENGPAGRRQLDHAGQEIAAGE